jgi:hypothetical protein
MAYRKRLSRKVSRKVFRRASGTNKKNDIRPVMRGGIRL